MFFSDTIPITMPNTSEIRQRAIEAYDANPTPSQMLEILGFMIEGIGNALAIRQNVTSEDALLALKDWDKDVENFLYRLYDYQIVIQSLTGTKGVSKAAEHHHVPIGDIPRVYNELVVAPILYGDSASTIAPDSWPYSKVHFPDVITAASLYNQIDALPPQAFNISEHAKRQVGEWFIEAINWIWEATGDDVTQFARDRADDLAKIGDEAIDEHLPGLIQKAEAKVKAHTKKKAKELKGQLIPYAIGAGALVALAFRKR